MARTKSRIVLGIFILSISVVPLLDFCHDLLHRVENPFHHHTPRQSRGYVTHTFADHHFQKMKFAHEMDDVQPPTCNFIALLYGVGCEPLSEPPLALMITDQKPNTRSIEVCYLFHTCPPTPPPPARARL